jgi:hypothetical protein
MHFTIRYRDACVLPFSGHFFFSLAALECTSENAVKRKFAEHPFYELG